MEAVDAKKKKKAEEARWKHEKEKEITRRVRAEEIEVTSSQSLSRSTPQRWGMT